MFALKDFQTSKQCKSLGKGAYGEVQLVQHIPSKVQYALKVIKKRNLSRSSSLKMMQREIQVQKKLIHPNIIRLHGHIEDMENLYLVLEYAEKGNLFHYIRKRKKLTEEEAWYFFTQVCTGVNYLHEGSITHRDLKPENILITSSNLAKICDFGWCAEGNSERSTYCGTLDYMAPEILKGYQYTNSVDVWALGVLLYEMLHGCPPFNAKNDSEKSRLIRLGNFRFAEEVPEDCRDLIRSILQGTAEARPSVLEVLAHPWVDRVLQVQTRVKVDLRSFAPGCSLSVPDLGQGIIVSQRGLVCEASFHSCTRTLIISELAQKMPVVLVNDNLDEDKGYELKIARNYPASYKSSGGSRGRPPRPNYISTASINSQQKSATSVKSDSSGGFSPMFNFEKRGGSNNIEYGDKNSIASSGGLSSGSEGTEAVVVNPKVMAQRVEELQRLQKQLEGPVVKKARKGNSERGFFSKIGGIFGFG